MDWAASRLKEDGGHMTSTGVLRLNVPTTLRGRPEYGKKWSTSHVTDVYKMSSWQLPA